MRRKESALRTWRVVAVIVTLAVVACSSDDGEGGPPGTTDVGSPQQGGTLRVARSESFDGWVLDSAAAYASYQTQFAVIEPLVRSSPDGQSLEPGLAESWTYDPEGPAWTFVLREDLVFSDGTPLTSADVAFSATIWAEGPNFGAVYEGIRTVRTPDDHTVVFELYDPDSTLPVVLSWSASGVMPEDFGGRTEDEYYEQPIGAGAFTVQEWSPGGRIVLQRNDRFYDSERPYVDEIVIDVITDANERAVQLQSGQVDIAEYVSPITAPQYGEAIVPLPTSQVEHLSLNTTKAPFDDVDVRRAIAYAIDYESIVGGPFAGYATAPQGIIAPNLPNWAPPSLPPFSRDLDEANRLLAGSTHPDLGRVELVYDSGLPADNLTAQVVQSNLEEIGVDVELTGLETGAFLDRAFGLDADIVLWSYGAISPDVIDPVGWILGTSWLFTGFETDTLLDRWFAYTATESTEEKQEIITQIQDEAMEQAQAISLAEFQVLHAAREDVRDFASPPWGVYYYDPIWLAS
jgi:peptide/nickel transport system substrate-binding protein